MGLRLLTPLRKTVSGSSLLTGLVSYWTMNETSGTRVDTLGVNSLNTLSAPPPGFTTGIIDNAMNVTDVGMYASSGKILNPAGSFTFAGWFNYSAVNTGASNYTIFGNINSDISFWVVQKLNSFEFRVSSDNSTVVSRTSGVSLSTSTNYFCVFYYDNVGHTIGVSTNGAAALTTSFTGPVYASTNFFSVGNGYPFGITGMMGWIDEMGYWSRVLTSGEITTLYNSGAGLTYPF